MTKTRRRTLKSLALAGGLTLFSIAALYLFVEARGGFIGANESEITWMSASNYKMQLSQGSAREHEHAHDEINQKEQATATAEIPLPTLIVECETVSACTDGHDLNLKIVSKRLQGKVTVLAIDMSANDKFSQQFEGTVQAMAVDVQILKASIKILAAEKPELPTPDAVTQFRASDRGKQLEAHVREHAKNDVLFRAAYPKFVLFSAQGQLGLYLQNIKSTQGLLDTVDRFLERRSSQQHAH